MPGTIVKCLNYLTDVTQCDPKQINNSHSHSTNEKTNIEITSLSITWVRIQLVHGNYQILHTIGESMFYAEKKQSKK